MDYKKLLIRATVSFSFLIVIFVAMVWFTTFHPAEVQAEPVNCTKPAPLLQEGQSLKTLVWNVQFMAGKDYVFWFDVPGNDGPDERPSPENITRTIESVARVIQEENPDIILLQEIDIGAERTDHEDQLTRLLALLSSDYICSTSAFYWKASYVYHPRVHGAVGLSTAIVSKYRITTAKRHQLALDPNSWLYQQMNTKRAVLEARLPIEQGGEFVALNTHLDAFSQGSNTMELQVTKVNSLLASLTNSGFAWVIGGDFNLLPPGNASYQRLPVSHQSYYNSYTEIESLYAAYQAVPSIEEVSGAAFQQWFSHYPNDPEISGPDRTIDYLFFDKTIQIGEHYVRQSDTLRISDHLPISAEFRLP